MSTHASACFIVGRNLGDAVIQNVMIAQLAERRFADRFVVWTRPQVAHLFATIPHCTVLTSQFPVGTVKNFGARQWWPFLSTAMSVRAFKPDVSVDFMGDFRERLFARLVGAPVHLSPSWDFGHPMTVVTRNPFGAARSVFPVPRDCVSVYQAYQGFVDRLAGGASPHLRPPASRVEARPEVGKLIGIHPFASQECKLWPAENWRALISALSAAGSDLVVFAAPGEVQGLRQLLGEWADKVRIVCVSIKELEEHLAALSLFIGLDSLAVHLASKHDVPSVIIVGPNDHRVWSPPGTTVISHSGGCKAWPCYNNTVCEGTAGEYACMKSATVGEVLAASLHRLRTSAGR